MAEENSAVDPLYKLIFVGTQGIVEVAEGGQVLIAEDEAGQENIFMMLHKLNAVEHHRITNRRV